MATLRADLETAVARFDRLHAVMDEEKRILVDAFVKHMKRTGQSEAQREGYEKRSHNLKLKRAAMGVLGLLLMVTPAWAVGPVVGPGCTASWNAVTTYTDATPITGPVTYNLYVVLGSQTAPGVPPSQTGLTTTTANICTGRAAGQWTVFVSAVAGGTEGAASVASPFVLSLQIPSVPSNVIVR